MGGKRPDQYRIDPDEGRTTDHKLNPQTGLGKSSLDDTVEWDRKQVARSTQEAQEGPFPGHGSRPPSRDANRPFRDPATNVGEPTSEGRDALGRQGSGSDRDRQEPYVPIQDRDADVQNQNESESVPLSGANAAGLDWVGMDETERESIDEESMYENRPERDKDQKPSGRML